MVKHQVDTLTWRYRFDSYSFYQLLTLNTYISVMKEIMNEIEERFALALEAKTGWGKNEVLQVYTKIASEVYLEKLEMLLNRK